MVNRTTEANEAPARQVSAVLRQAARRLKSHGIENAALDSEVLLSHVLGLTREQLILSANVELRDPDLRVYAGLLSRRLARQPTAYLIGRREFWSLDFHVTPEVLIPRPETELLIEVALRLASEASSSEKPLRIIDLGTGSGAIAVALARELTGAEIFACDNSLAALAVAQKNASTNRVPGKIKFVAGDLFGFMRMDSAVDLVVSNPPYIRRADIEMLVPEVSRWEPRCALDGGPDGLDYYRRIAEQAFSYLAPKGAVAIETGADMGPSVAQLFQAAAWADVQICKDYAGNDRVVVARKMSSSVSSS